MVTAGHELLIVHTRCKIKGLALAFRQQFSFCIQLPLSKQNDVKNLFGVSKFFSVTLLNGSDPSNQFGEAPSVFASLSQCHRECRCEAGVSTGVQFTPAKATGQWLQVCAPTAGASLD